jgi:predicted amidohydrolase YtcJ
MQVLDVFERVEIKNGGARNCTRPRHRMEHSQHHADSSTAGRIAKAEVHVVGNPLHLLPDKRVLDERLGTERAQRSFAYNSMIKVSSLKLSWLVISLAPCTAYMY